MTRNTVRRALVCSVFALAGGLSSVDAAELVRGPYLQTATPESITIRWRTDTACESVVSYGTSTNDLSAALTNLTLTTEHEVRLTGLSPDTQYFYAVGSLEQSLATGLDCNFITHPTPGVPKPTRVWITGDAGQSAPGVQARMRDAYFQYAGTRRTDVWLALGDNCYNYGTDAEYQDVFFNVYPTLLRQTAVWSTVGNHETYAVDPGQPLPYFDMFSFPTNAEAGGVPSGSEGYYSFNYANIHFVCLDSMTDFLLRDPDGPMVAWLRADLAANTNQWLIAFWHAPPYSKNYHDSDNDSELVEMRQTFLPILEAYGVDLVLCGHNHVYERSFLLHGHYGYSSTLQPEMIHDSGSGRESETGAYIKETSGPRANQGTVYVEVGCSGSVRTNRPGQHPAMFLNEFQIGSFVLDISSNRLDAAFLRDTGAIDDSFTIIKDQPETFRLLPLILQNGKVILRWKSIPGQMYCVERADNWTAPNWQSACEPATATGATTSWTNDITPGGVQYLFRVVQLPTTAGRPGVAAAKATKEPWIQDQPTCTSDWLVTVDTWDQEPTGSQPAKGEKTGWGASVPEGVICDTIYWRRKFKGQPQLAGLRGRASGGMVQRNAASHVAWGKYIS